MSVPAAGRPTRETISSWRQDRLVRLAVAAFFITRVVLLSHHHLQTDIHFYHAYFVRAIAGEVPYRDIAIAYPPAAWGVMELPGVADWSAYRDRFRMMMAGFDVAAFALFTVILLRRRPEFAGWGSLTYVATTVALEPLLYDRLDVVLLFLLVLWAYAYTRAETQNAPTAKWRVWGPVAFFVLGLSVAYKLVPAVMFPFLGLGELMGGRSRRAVGARFVGFAVGLTLPFVAQYPVSGFDSLGFMRYHLARGIQIESVYAVPLWIMSRFGLPLAVADLPDTVELRGALVPLMVQSSNFASVAFVGGLAAHGLWRRRQYSGGDAYVYAWLALVGLILFAKGLSPQYFIWIIPALVLCGADLLSPRDFRVLSGQLLALSILTTVVFPWGFRGLLALDPQIMLVLAIRNLLFAAVLGWLLMRCLGRQRCECHV
jgi:hypothetical protein